MTQAFFVDMAERAIKTAAQAAIASIGAAGVMGDVNWLVVGSTTLLATILSVLTSIASIGIGDEGTASVLTTETTDCTCNKSDCSCKKH